MPGRRLGSYTSYLLLNPLPYCTEKGVRVVGANRSLPRTLYREYSLYRVRGHGEDKCILISLYFLFLLLTSLLNINCTRLLHCTGTVSFTVQVLYSVQCTEYRKGGLVRTGRKGRRLESRLSIGAKAVGCIGKGMGYLKQIISNNIN